MTISSFIVFFVGFFWGSFSNWSISNWAVLLTSPLSSLFGEASKDLLNQESYGIYAFMPFFGSFGKKGIEDSWWHFQGYFFCWDYFFILSRLFGLNGMFLFLIFLLFLLIIFWIAFSSPGDSFLSPSPSPFLRLLIEFLLLIKKNNNNKNHNSALLIYTFATLLSTGTWRKKMSNLWSYGLKLH